VIPPLARRFVAGETAAEALDHATTLNDRGGAILNHLGEHYETRGPVDADADAYRRLVDDVEQMDLDACISAKPSQLGLSVDEDVFRENFASRRLRRRAGRLRLAGHGRLHDDGRDAGRLRGRDDETRRGVGVCLQSNLRRTHDDLERLADLPGKVRLVKGGLRPAGGFGVPGQGTRRRPVSGTTCGTRSANF